MLCLTNAGCRLDSAQRRVQDAKHDTTIQRAPTSFVRAVIVGDHQISLDSTATLASVQAILGQRNVVLPEDHDGFSSVCYVIASPRGKQLLWLQSNEMGGRDQKVLGFVLSAVGPDENANCLAAQPVSAQVRTDNGLMVGMMLDALIAVMGRPASDSGGVYMFEHSGRVEKPGLGVFDATGTLRVVAPQGVVVELRGWYVLTS